jgi:hypothetical protein
MAAFVRVSAVLVGLANAAVFALSSDKPIGDASSYFPGDLPSWPLAALFALCAVVAGLSTSEVVLRFVRGGLRGDFYARHLTMARAVALGGMLLGALLISASSLTDTATSATDRVVGALIMGPGAELVFR